MSRYGSCSVEVFCDLKQSLRFLYCRWYGLRCLDLGRLVRALMFGFWMNCILYFSGCVARRAFWALRGLRSSSGIIGLSERQFSLETFNATGLALYQTWYWRATNYARWGAKRLWSWRTATRQLLATDSRRWQLPHAVFRVFLCSGRATRAF